MKSFLLKLTYQIISCFAVLFFSVIPITAYGDETPNISSMPRKTKIRTVIVADYYPYTFVNKEGIPDGFSVDLLKAVGSVMDMDVEIGVDTWEHARMHLETGNIDLLPMMAYSKERDGVFDFSAPHTIAYDAFFTRTDRQQLKTIEDVKGQTVIVMKDDQAHDYLRSSGLAEHLILIDSLPEALRLLASGRGDMALMPKLVGLTLIRDMNLTNLIQSPIVVESYNRPFSIAVREGNQLLLERLNQGLTIIRKTGQYREIYDKWFGILEPKELTLKSVLKYIVGLLLALLLIASAFALWSFSLKKQVRKRTAELETVNQSFEEEIAERRRFEKALQKSSDEIYDLYNHAPCGYHSIDKDGLFVRMNDTELQWLGYTREEILGEKNFSDLITERSRKTYHYNFPLFKERGWIRDLEFEMVRKDGSILPVILSATAVMGGDGSYVMSRATVYEISERVQAEKMRRLLSTIVDSSDEAIISKDLNGIILSWNSGAQRMYGYAAEEIIGKPILLIVPSDRADEHYSIMEMLSEGKGVRHFESERIRKDSSRFPVSLSIAPLYDAEGKVFGGSTIARDITERRRAEKVLRESEEKYRTLFEESFDGLFITSPDGKILDMNKKGIAMFGYDTKEEVMRLDLECDIYAYPPDRKRILAMVNAQGVAEYEVVVKKKSGETMVTYCSLSAVKNETGVISGYRGIIRDITGKKQAEAALRESKRQKELILNSTAEMVTYYDLDLRVIWANRASAESAGRSPEEMVGLHCYEMWQNRCEACEDCPVLKARDDKTPG